MEKKITIKDVAKMAGVSVATVSYVINDRTDQRISEETKKRVLQIINLMDYRPNSSAKSLATKKTFNISLCLSKEDSLLKRSEQLLMIQALTTTLKEHGYHLYIQDNQDITNLGYVDAILAFDVSEDYFSKIGDTNFVPVIAIDIAVGSDLCFLFFQVCTNYKKIYSVAYSHFGNDSFTYLCLKPNSSKLESLIKSFFPSIRFIEDVNDLLNLPVSNYVYHHESFRPFLKENPFSLYVKNDMTKKANQIFQCFEYAQNRVTVDEHLYYV